MKKAFTILISLIFITGSILGQKTNDGGKTGGGGGDNNNNNDESCQNTCMNTAVDIAGTILGDYHKKLLNSNDPTVTSFEIMLHGGIGLTDEATSFYFALPRVKLNYGALSADLRYNYSVFENVSSSFLDALVEFNIIAGNSFKMSIGQGIMFPIVENETNIFHESFIGMDISIMNKMIIVSPEFRLAYDWNISKPVNSEISLRGGYKIFGSSSFSVYANIAATYQYIYDTNNTFVYGGLDVFIH